MTRYLAAVLVLLFTALPIFAVAQESPRTTVDGLWSAIARLQEPAGGTASEIRTENVTTRLLADAATAVPGSTITLAIVQDIREGWHTYWLNPGDSGAPATLVWDLPTGVTIGPSQWPAPEAIPYFGLMTFGHQGRLALLHELEIPADWPVGRPLPVRLDMDWLVCAEICIPEQGKLALEIAVGAAPVPAEAAILDLLETARSGLPKPSPWPVAFAGDDEVLRLKVDIGDMPAHLTELRFFPLEPGLIENVGEPVWQAGAEGLLLEQPRRPDGAPLPASLAGVLLLGEALPDGQVHQAFTVQARFDPAIGRPGLAGTGLLPAVLLALAGGLLLNLMPCVFPVLSLKALALVQHAGHERAAMQGAAYTLGVLLAFLMLAGLLVVLQAGGALVGWGFQMQEPVVVTLLAYLVFAIGLWLIGVIDPGTFGLGRFMGIGQDRLPQDRLAGSFMTGLLAVVVASPCTAPFMATAIGFGLTQKPATTVAIFIALGLGLALPYLVLSLSPALQRRLPRPGPWLLRFRQLMAFPMFATAAWLVWVLAQQAGDRALLLVLMGFVVLGLAAWMLRFGGRAARTTAIVAIAGALVLAALPARLAGTATSNRDELAEPFSTARLEELVQAERPAFVNMTAAWCLTCLVNERTALDGLAFETALERLDITYLKGDWTRRNPEITRFLRRFERAGVPLYVFFPGRGAPIVLPQLLTEQLVLDVFSDNVADG